MIDLKFYPDGKVPEQPHLYFIYGAGGTGKTSLLKQFKGKKLLITFDNSYEVVRGREDIDVLSIEPKDFKTLKDNLSIEIMERIKDGKYQVLCLDNATALQNIALDNIFNQYKDNRNNYQDLQIWFRRIGTYLRQCGLTVYVTAHQDKPNELGEVMPQMNFATFYAFTATFDFVGHIYKKDNEFWIDCDPEKKNHGKNRIDNRTSMKAEDLLNAKTKEKKENEVKEHEHN